MSDLAIVCLGLLAGGTTCMLFFGWTLWRDYLRYPIAL
jgi:hypothetical protein